MSLKSYETFESDFQSAPSLDNSPKIARSFYFLELQEAGSIATDPVLVLSEENRINLKLYERVKINLFRIYRIRPKLSEILVQMVEIA